MSEFAQYVEKQQAARRAGRDVSVAPSDSGYATESTATEDHAELDILDSLDLSEESAHVRLKDLLLETSAESEDRLQQLSNLVQSRILEGHGETLFELGQENNGESMGFSKAQWDTAIDRLQEAARQLQADCRVLLTRNVGGEFEIGSLNDKNTGASGKVMIRQRPETVEDVIETRIAVVGNGTRDLDRVERTTDGRSRCWKKHHAWGPSEGQS